MHCRHRKSLRRNESAIGFVERKAETAMLYTAPVKKEKLPSAITARKRRTREYTGKGDVAPLYLTESPQVLGRARAIDGGGRVNQTIAGWLQHYAPLKQQSETHARMWQG